MTGKETCYLYVEGVKLEFSFFLFFPEIILYYLNRFIPETVSENTTFTSGFKFFKKSVVPHQSYSFTQTTTLDVEIQTEHHLAPNVLDVHNIEIYSSEPCEK